MSDDILFDNPAADTHNRRSPRWARWQPEPIASMPPETEPVEQTVNPEKQELRLQNMLARIRKQAQEQGYTDGHAAGHADGMKQGLAQAQEQGHKEGYQAGLDAGHQQGLEKAEEAAAQLAALAQECASALSNLEADMGQALITLAIRIAEHVLHQTLDTKPDTILALLDGLLRLDTGDPAALRLYVNPADLTLVREHLGDQPDTSQWRVLSDESVARGGCKAHTSLGDIDATLETRWRRITSSISGES